MVSTRATPRATRTTSSDIDVSDYSALTTRRAASSRWSHQPTLLSLVWLAVSLPLVAWDTGYVLLRPASMPGGSLHWPLWAPYELYGRVDHMYGEKQWQAGNGFTAAQGALNAIESALYLAYLALWWRGARPDRSVGGRAGALAVMLAFSAAVMTVSKTVLYWLNEYYSGFDNIGHNKLADLILLWIIPNGAWLVFPSIMIYDLGSEIINGLAPPASARKSE